MRCGRLSRTPRPGRAIFAYCSSVVMRFARTTADVLTLQKRRCRQLGVQSRVHRVRDVAPDRIRRCALRPDITSAAPEHVLVRQL